MSLKQLSIYFRKSIFLLSMFMGSIIYAQNQKTIQGVVLSEGIPMPDATVVAKGTKTGTTTDFDGKFTLTVPSDVTTITVSFVGYVSQDVKITKGEMIINLIEDSNTLDEVIINVGYGSQKKSVVTGAISKVSAKDLEKQPIGRVESALQGKTSGVIIANNSGQPGSSATVRVRGITTFDTSNDGNSPLWVVDGIVIDNGALSTLNQSDIESIEVLKDAASLAIYGARAASGVILVTTKKGKSGSISIALNSNTSLQTPSKFLELLNASEYAGILNEKAVAAGQNPLFSNMAQFGEGTDWQAQIFNNALKISNDLSIMGGSDKATYFFSLGQMDQDGIVLKEISNYKKYNVRLNADFKVKDWLTIGEKMYFTQEKSIGIGNTNSEYGGPLSSALNLDPITPVIITDPIIANSYAYSNEYIIRDVNGNPYGISNLVGQEMTNPLAYEQTRFGQFGKSENYYGNVYAELKIMDGLKFKSVFGGKLAYWMDEGFVPKYYLSSTVNNLILNRLYRNQYKGANWTVENTLTYDKVIGAHSFNVLLGQGAYKDGMGYGLYTEVDSLTYTNNYQDATFNHYSYVDEDFDGGTYNFTPKTTTSLFARLNYNFNEKYIFTGIIRRDGSSMFGANYKYGIFPSFSAGWVVSRESFWIENQYINNLKIRGGYGETGNDRIGNFAYIGLIGGGYNYTWSNSNQITVGAAPSRVPNPDIHWEATKQTDIGFESKFLSNFNFNFDWYNKKTTGILRPIPIPGYLGAEGDPIGNVADMINKGIELELGYNKTFNDWTVSANANFSTLKNEVTFLGFGIDEITENSAGFQSMGSITVTRVGEAYNSFFGYQTDGVFQNQAEIDAYTYNGQPIQPNAVPGDFRWKDNNNDGQINDDDKSILGSFLPKVNFGFSTNVNYKNWDASIVAYGGAGNKIFKGIRRLDILNANYSTDILQRWTGEGSTNVYPRLTNDDTNGNFGKMSNFYLENGDYLKFKVVQLGYTIKANENSKIGLDKIRIYISGENLYTITKYSGYDPEIGGNVLGIDKGYYPQARTYTAGVNVQF